MTPLFLIGLAMGTADLIPGISGGTVAFLAGIYDRLLQELKSFSLKNFSWRFFLPLGSGLVLALLIGAQLFTFLLARSASVIYAFFFGVVLVSTAHYARAFAWQRWHQALGVILGALLCFLFSGDVGQVVELRGFWGLMCAGALAAMALLLPGISGCYMLHLLGVYPQVLEALSAPWHKESLATLIPVALGVGLGVIGSARLISYLIRQYGPVLIPFLIGLMCGGLRSLWFFTWPVPWETLLSFIIGVMLVLFLRFVVSRKRAIG